jgi:uncharacterized protein YhbP (UPF0306 family)
MSTRQTTVELPPKVLDFLQGHQTLTLATSSSAGTPHASTFLYVNDGPNLYFWTRATTTTARHLQQNPVVAFTIDEYTDDLRQTRGVQGLGECSVLLQGEQIARVAALFGDKFPSLAPGSTLSISFFRITPTDVQFIDNTGAGDQSEGTFGADFHRERSYSVIADLPKQSPDNIIASLKSIEVPSGETLVRRGGPADRFFILIEGEAAVIGDEGGQERPIATLSPGQLFGEVAIMRDQPRAATVRANTDAKLLALERDTFRDLIARALEITPDFDQVIRARLDNPGDS